MLLDLIFLLKTFKMSQPVYKFTTDPSSSNLDQPREPIQLAPIKQQNGKRHNLPPISAKLIPERLPQEASDRLPPSLIPAAYPERLLDLNDENARSPVRIVQQRKSFEEALLLLDVTKSPQATRIPSPVYKPDSPLAKKLVIQLTPLEMNASQDRELLLAASFLIRSSTSYPEVPPQKVQKRKKSFSEHEGSRICAHCSSTVTVIKR